MRTYIAEIITIGNEILSGRTVNTNASHIARRLTSIGFTVRRITTVMDDLQEISSIFREALDRKPSLIVSTGGLGPTYDDKTAEGLALGLNKEMEYNEQALNQIKEKYQKLGLELTEERKKMAYMPKGSIPIENDQGIAPGIYIMYNDIEILALPGVPREMENILENFIKRYLKTRPNVKYVEKSIIINKVMESALAPYVKQLVKKYDLYIKTHPRGYELSNPSLEVQVAGSSENEEEITKKIDDCLNEIKNIAKNLGGIIEN
ncbi:nicotinamide mononucleotide deamidase-related protein [Acidianus sulfidivorans JP7]|uniref:Protein DFR86_05655 n=1 Tax=Acidianus sulfidivorans JP7 TaxID=619593 RepID=A0A2U9IM05_9CREN|nr:nicotinamide mononucleotide deamidase-related protein [Acidianus sulfidivorans]AWR97099.1 nicotinamide mononucleotide deamidase-related protein [Acidianus sulfidivorans JP7]